MQLIIFQLHVLLVIGILQNIGFTGRHLQHIKGVNIYVQQLLRMAFGVGNVERQGRCHGAKRLLSLECFVFH